MSCQMDSLAEYIEVSLVDTSPEKENCDVNIRKRAIENLITRQQTINKRKLFNFSFTLEISV